MKSLETYLSRRVSFPVWIKKPPLQDLFNVIVIPCHDETGILDTLNSLTVCYPQQYPVEVIIVINTSEKDPDEVANRNRKTWQEILQWTEKNKTGRLSFFPLLAENLPAKISGVGLARKIGMDEAVRRFILCRRSDGIITSLDADTLVDPDYLVTIEKYFSEKQETEGVSIYFEHPLNGTQFPEIVYKGITLYELHLRYFLFALRRINYPFAFHTVGSAFAVRAEAYARQGGMNTRQGGEDFYFLQKIIKHGHYADLTATRVIPSPRPGTKVPFGTGPEINRFLTGEKTDFFTYAPEAFADLADFFSHIKNIYREKIPPETLFLQLPFSIGEFLGKELFIRKINEILGNVASEKTFMKRFYHWFDMFHVIKYLNESHKNLFIKQPVTAAAAKLLAEAGVVLLPDIPGALLQLYRDMEKKQGESGSEN